ncbi:hypothetical protein RclHR1_14390002 [Rhizophagus clarus]|uniref:Protein kinase domain-containing protein n=1 Tax=Rhizophagus clarus TaxID=94130 RepID=A0A2Z6QGV2_9GLOM|nr:hypothetical protein RclHR1_14390002 [Rhizophagus clarus]
MEKRPKNLWKYDTKYQNHVIISNIDSNTELEDADEKIVYMEDLEKRKEAYGICGEYIDEFIRQSQLNAVHYRNCLEWIPFEKFQNVTYIAEGGFGKIYSAEWTEGVIGPWNIENQEWHRFNFNNYALKSLKNSSDICSNFLNEIKSHLKIYLKYTLPCHGITQDPNTKEYMMVLFYCGDGNLRDYLSKSEYYIDYRSKIDKIQGIARGLLNIHNSGFVHKDFHSVKVEGVYGVLPYMAPEVLCGHQYTKEADIYSFGIIMNEFLSEEIPFNDIPHDEFLAIKIYKGYRPKISKGVPKLLVDLIMKCWDVEVENRPTANKEFFKNRANEDKSKNLQAHPQTIYTSRLLNFKNLPKPVNSSDLSFFHFNSDVNDTIQSTMPNPISECLDVQLSELGKPLSSL